MCGGSVGVNVNGVESNFFKIGKGLRQGDPLSPLIFNLVGDALTKMLEKAAKKGLIKGLLTDFNREGIISLQYADDTILFSSAEDEHLNNLKCELACFETISGMRINFHKSEIIPVNVEGEDSHGIAHIFGCPVGSFPIKYLGILLHHDRLRKEDLQPIIDKIIKRIAGWRGRLLSYSGRLILIKTCLASIPVYLMSYIKLPKWAINLINSQMSHCLWNHSSQQKSFHLANWPSMCTRKEYGGLGIPDIRQLNMCLLGSWIRRYNIMRIMASYGKKWLITNIELLLQTFCLALKKVVLISGRE